MQWKDDMTSHVRGLADHESVREAAEVMNRMGVGAVPIFQDGEPGGIVTEFEACTTRAGTPNTCRLKTAQKVAF